MCARLPSFWLKCVLAAGVVAAADVLLWRVVGFGLNIGLMSVAVAGALALSKPALWRNRLSCMALAVAALLSLLQLERPSFVAFLLWAVALAVAALAPRAPAGDDGWRWSQRLIVGGVKALVGPLLDFARLLKARARGRRLRLSGLLLAALLPVGGAVLFLSLFAAANPVIAQAFERLRVPEPNLGRVVFWGVIFGLAWALLRPRGLRRPVATPELAGELGLPGVTAASIPTALAVFNLVFAVQNGLDLAYLWSGAGLPKGVTFADYAHRGAYPLIATALLAGLFVLVFLRPGSRTASLRSVRWLVAIWVAQNLFLVASTALRTWDYVEAYSLTRLRIAALIWMALVAAGLALILWRLLRGKSASWLINANLLCVASVLAGCCVVDLGAVAAVWNVRNARQVGGRGVELDLEYLRSLRGAAAVPLAELERRPLAPSFRCFVTLYRRRAAADMARYQADWRTWRWRDERRLARVRALTFEAPFRPEQLDDVPCHQMAAPQPPPLTPQPNAGT